MRAPASALKAIAPTATPALPPHSIEAEQGILGSILEDPKAIEDISGLKPEHFYDVRHVRIFKAILSLQSRSERIDTITVYQTLKDLGTLDDAGGMVYLGELPSKSPSSANCPNYVAIVKDKALLRETMQICTSGIAKANSSMDANKTVDDIERDLWQLRESVSPVNILDAKGVARASVDDLERRYELGGKLSGIASGFVNLDRITDGFQRKEMAVIGARPSMGKTALGLCIVSHAIKELIPTLVVTLEMGPEALTRRMLSDWATIPLSDIKRGSYSEGDFKKFTTFHAAIRKAPFWIINGLKGLTIDQLSTAVRRYVRRHGVQLVVVDYLQKIAPSQKHEKRTYEVGSVSQQLKAIADTNNVAMVALAQLNRESEDDKGRVPRLSDLGDSKQIEQDADLVVLIHRDRSATKGEASLIVVKQRDGEVGFVKLGFNGEYCRFEDSL